jgi:hypothetical protein
MNPIITDINPETLEKLNTLLSRGSYGKRNYTMTPTLRKELIKKGIGGLCLCCYEIPTKVVCYDMLDSEINSKLVERFCKSCFSKCSIILTATNGNDQTMAIRKEGRE